MAKTLADFLQRVLGRNEYDRPTNPDDDRYAAAYINWQLEQQMLRQDVKNPRGSWW